MLHYLSTDRETFTRRIQYTFTSRKPTMAETLPVDVRQATESFNDNECGICLERNQRAKQLPCLHSFCRDCLHTYIKQHAVNDVFMCPLCRNPTPVPEDKAGGFEDNIVMAVESHTYPSTAVCDACEESPVSSKCIECEQSYCSFCSKAHVKMKINREHQHDVTRWKQSQCYI